MSLKVFVKGKGATKLCETLTEEAVKQAENKFSVWVEAAGHVRADLCSQIMWVISQCKHLKYPLGEKQVLGSFFGLHKAYPSKHPYGESGSNCLENLLEPWSPRPWHVYSLSDCKISIGFPEWPLAGRKGPNPIELNARPRWFPRVLVLAQWAPEGRSLSGPMIAASGGRGWVCEYDLGIQA